MHASELGVTPRSLIAAVFDDAEWLQSDLQNEIADVLCVELVCRLCAPNSVIHVANSVNRNPTLAKKWLGGRNRGDWGLTASKQSGAEGGTGPHDLPPIVFSGLRRIPSCNHPSASLTSVDSDMHVSEMFDVHGADATTGDDQQKPASGMPGESSEHHHCTVGVTATGPAICPVVDARQGGFRPTAESLLVSHAQAPPTQPPSA